MGGYTLTPILDFIFETPPMRTLKNCKICVEGDKEVFVSIFPILLNALNHPLPSLRHLEVEVPRWPLNETPKKARARMRSFLNEEIAKSPYASRVEVRVLPRFNYKGYRVEFSITPLASLSSISSSSSTPSALSSKTELPHDSLSKPKTGIYHRPNKGVLGRAWRWLKGVKSPPSSSSSSSSSSSTPTPR